MARNAAEREQAIRDYGNARRRLGRREPDYRSGERNGTGRFASKNILVRKSK